MKLMSAFCHHAWLVLSLQHDGKGMPKKAPAALFLAIAYCILAVSHLNPQDIQFETICCLLFITQFYVFLLRNPLIGLLIMIGTVCNTLQLLIVALGFPEITQLMLAIFEYVMVLFAILNVLKTHQQLN